MPEFAFSAMTVQTPTGSLSLIVLENDQILDRVFVGCVKEDALDKVLAFMKGEESDPGSLRIQWYEKWDQEIARITNAALLDVLEERVRWRQSSAVAQISA